jgi:hypothetical protein
MEKHELSKSTLSKSTMRSKLCCNSVPIRSQTLCINRVSVLVSFSGSGKRGRFFAQLARAGSRVAERSL